MKPLIGVTLQLSDHTSHSVKNAYLQAVYDQGGIPLLLPTGMDSDAGRIADMLDGLLLTGGEDLNPLLYGEEPLQQLGSVSPERDSFEIALVKEMLQHDKPILGICRGLQVLNVVLGGTLYQDMYSQTHDSLIQHMQLAPRSHLSHSVRVEPGSKLQTITDQNEFLVNSFHHQSVKEIAPGLFIAASSPDGIVEAIESKIHRYVIGVQWHPEDVYPHADNISKRLFTSWISACNERKMTVENH